MMLPVPPASAPAAPAAPSAAADSRAELRRTAAGFEEMFLVFMLRAGRASGVGDSLTGSSAVSSTRDMLDAQLARSAAGRPGLGIAEAVVRQFSPDGRG